MGSWFQNQIRKAEELLESVDRTAKHVVSEARDKDIGVLPPAVGKKQSPTIGRPASANARAKPSRPSRPSDDQAGSSSTGVTPRALADPPGSPFPRPSDGDRARTSPLPPREETGSETASPPELRPTLSSSALADSPLSLGGRTGSFSRLADATGPAADGGGTEREGPGEDETAGGQAKQIPEDVAANGTVEETSDKQVLSPTTGDPGSSGSANGVPAEGGAAGAASGSEVDAAEEEVKEVKVDGEGSGREVTRGEEAGVSNAVRVQDMLEEARGLLKAASNSAAPSREARLARICEVLSARVQEYKQENAQLEELIQKQWADSGSMGDRVQGLEAELGTAKGALAAAQEEMAAALAVKNAELEAMTVVVDVAKRQAAVAEGRLASLQASSEAVAKTREFTEARMVQALRDELTAAERRLEEERAAHHSTRQSAQQRETELEQRLADSTASFMKMQRVVDDKVAKTGDLEAKLSMMEVECATLNQELQDSEARLRRELKKGEGADNTSSQAGTWRQEADRARQAQLAAEGKLASAEVELKKLRAELATIKKDSSSQSSQAHAELEKRFRELTELLYLKQTQVETLSSEKAAAELHLEKEKRRAKEARAEADRTLVSRQRSMAMDDQDLELGSLDSLGQNLPTPVRGVKSAAKFLDRKAVSAVKFLWRRPLARLSFLAYLVFVHLFMMYLMHRLQEFALASIQGIEHDRRAKILPG